MEQPSASPDDDAPDWPLHQRLSGVVARTVTVGLALLPAAALLAREAGDAAKAFALSLVFAFPLLAVERRDRSVLGALLWQLLAAAIAVAFVPVAVVSLEHVGDPEAAYGALGDLLHARTFVALLIGAPAASALLGLLFAVRVRTSRLGPQLLAGLVIPVLMTSGWLDPATAFPWRVTLLLLLAGALVPLALVGAERVMASRDPRAPRPVERDPRPCFAAFGLALLLLSLLPAVATRAARRAFFAQDLVEPGAALIDTCSVMLRNAARGPSWTAAHGFPWMNEPRNGYLVRVLVADGGRRWCVVADPVDPGLADERSWVGDHTGAVVSYAAPVVIDADACTAPPGGRPR